MVCFSRWTLEEGESGIRDIQPNKSKITQILKRLPGLQTNFRAKLIAIHKTLKIITTKYPNEPAHIFTDCLNCLYVINTQIKHPTQHDNHVDKTILTSMVEMLKTRTQPTTIYKVKAHTNINGNEQADILAKNDTKKNKNKIALKAYEFAHTTHHTTFRKTHGWAKKRSDKSLIRCLETCIKKHDPKKKLRNNGTTISQHLYMDNEPIYR